MERWTIWELQYAKEICFLDTFEELLKKHLPENKKEIWYIYYFSFKEKKGLINWIFSHSRDQLDKGWDKIINNILEDLTSNLRKNNN